MLRGRSHVLLFLLVGVFSVNFSLVSAVCGEYNQFTDPVTEECVCDFGRGYITHAVTYGSVCAKDSDSIVAGMNRYVSSCGVFSYSGSYFLSRDIDVANDPYFKEHGVCFVVGANNLNFNLNGYKLTNTNSSNFNDLTGIAVSGSNIIIGSSEGVSSISGFSGAGIYVYSASQNNKIENLNISKNRIGIYFGKSSTAIKSSSISNISGSENDYGLVVNLPSSFRNSIINLTNFGMDNYKDVSTSQKAIPISTCQELQNMSNNLSLNYKLIRDINCTGINFMPIGNLNNPFSGSLNGNGFMISDLTINNKMFPPRAYDYAGLFGVLNGLVQNVRIVNAYIEGRWSISGQGATTGGIAGLQNIGSVIIDSSFSGNIFSKWNAGGLVGESSGEILNSYSTGLVMAGYSSSIDSYLSVGGVVGLQQGTGKIMNSYSGMLVNSNGGYPGYDQQTGGLIGKALGQISNSYSYGSVTGGPKYYANPTGGLVSTTPSSEIINNSYWDINTSGQSGSAGGLGLTTSQMKNKTIFQTAGWDSSIWNLTDGEYPSLKGSNIGSVGVSFGLGVNVIAGDKVFVTSDDRMWSPTLNYTPVDWDVAKSSCENYDYAGFTDWNLPSSGVAVLNPGIVYSNSGGGYLLEQECHESIYYSWDDKYFEREDDFYWSKDFFVYNAEDSINYVAIYNHIPGQVELLYYTGFSLNFAYVRCVRDV